jgi:cell division protein FtsN
VQVAAYDARPGAEALAARLVARGFDARVTGGADGTPFRVRVGRFATRAEALAAQRDLRRRGLAGWVAPAEPLEAGAPATPSPATGVSPQQPS